MQEIVIETIGDFSREVRALLSSSQKWLFRGQADTCWDLLPSVHRGYSRQQERYLTNEFRVRARSRYPACPSNDDYPGWLALMQHYGLPTRLLDWTYSPLVAAFFSVHPDYVDVNVEVNGDADAQHDACIWGLSAGELNESQGFEPLIFPLDAASYQPLIAPAFKNREEPNSVGVAMAIEHDARIQLQQGAFTIHSCRTPLNCLPGSERLLCKFVIRHQAVQSLFEELSLLGMRKSNLFPDLASLTSELKSMHPPNSKEEDAGQMIGNARVLDLGGSTRRTRPNSATIRQEEPMEPTQRTASANDNGKKAGTEQAGLENQNVTHPAPLAPSESVRENRGVQNAGLEDLNVTQPSPPGDAASGGKTA